MVKEAWEVMKQSIPDNSLRFFTFRRTAGKTARPMRTVRAEGGDFCKQLVRIKFCKSVRFEINRVCKALCILLRISLALQGYLVNSEQIKSQSACDSQSELKNSVIPWQVIRYEPICAIRIGGLYVQKVGSFVDSLKGRMIVEMQKGSFRVPSTFYKKTDKIVVSSIVCDESGKFGELPRLLSLNRPLSNCKSFLLPGLPQQLPILEGQPLEESRRNQAGDALLRKPPNRAQTLAMEDGDGKKDENDDDDGVG
ncbi:hypothetical protein LguiA_005339 [Lonicera macranthoides]